MKTKFFKKLSFVLAVAMVLSVFAPAAGAFAAGEPKLNSTKKYLHLSGKPGSNEFNFNIKNKVKGWKYFWESADEAVAEVNEKNGVVTATGVGKTKITCTITDADGEEVAELVATVTVRDNIETVTIKNPVEKLNVGEEHDYNRSFVTLSGSTKKTSSVTRWTVDSDKADIDDKGVFVATEAGEYTVTALSFQSKARYDAWLDDPVANADEVLDTDETKVVVAGSMVEAKQVDLDTFEVTFDTAMVKADVEKNLKLSYLAGSTPVNHQIKEVKMDDANKVATVDVYSKFVEKSTYVVGYEGMESVQFVAASTDVKDVVSAAILTTTVQISVEEEIKVGLYNKDGVNIADNDLLTRVEMKSSNNATYLNGRKLSMYKVGDTTNVSIIYHTYEYDLTTGKEVGVVTAEALVACVEKKVDNVGLIDAYTVVASSPSFSNVKQKIAAGDTGLQLYVQLKGKMANGWQDKYTNNDSTSSNYSSLFKFTSSNPDVLIVSETGAVYPVKEGVVSVVVTHDNVVVGSATITVVASRRVAEIQIDNPSFILSNHTQVKDTKKVNIKVKDNLGDDYNVSKYSIETKINTGLTNEGTNAKKNNAYYKVLKSGDTTLSPVFEGTNAPAQQYTYTVTVTDTANGYSKMSRYITVTVAQPSDDSTVHHYAIEASKSVYDMKLYYNSSTDNDVAEDVTLSIFGYASNGVRNERVNVVYGAYKVKVKNPWGKEWTNYGSGTALTADGFDAKFSLVKSGTDSDHSNKSIYEKQPTGVYLLEAIDASGKAIHATYFEVKDSQATPTLKVNKLYTDKVDLLQAINDCFDFNLNGSDLAVESLDAVERGTATGSNSAFIQNVYVYEQVGSAYIKHKVAVNTVIHYAQ